MSATLLLGDCRHQPIICDAVITDPVGPNCPADLLIGQEKPQALLADALENVIAKRVVIVLRFDSDPRFLQAVPPRWGFFRACILPYAVPGYIGRKLGGIEIAYCFGDPVNSAPGRRVIPGMAPSVTKPTPMNGHTTPRAAKHFRWLVNWFSEPDETIYDPMMGSCTTGEAAIMLGRNFIGYEISEEYYRIAERRIRQAEMQGRLPGV